MKDTRPSHAAGLAAWSIRHPVGVTMIALAVVVLGLFALGKLSVDLLPHIAYPEIRVRIIDSGVPASIMEDRVTRQLEEQLAITEDAIGVQSRSTEGSASVDLSFEYGKDIDIALRDASTRLDRAKRFLPGSIDPPVIYKLDPSQLPAAEFVVASSERDTRSLRDWVDYDFAKQFLNLPGVAAVEVGGGVTREIQVLPDQQRLAAVGLTIDNLINALKQGNVDIPAGRLTMDRRELSGRTDARFKSVAEINALPLQLPDNKTIMLGELAQVIDTHDDERIKIRLNGTPGIKVSLQKQPTANTVKVVDAVNARLTWLQEQRLIPEDIEIKSIADQARYISNSLNNASLAAISGTLLAMSVVYLFLGNLRRTLIIGSAIPLAIMVTFVLMGIGGLTFNIMTLGGLALGVGMLVDNTIVMLENIYRHQLAGETELEAGTSAASEINSAIVAATSTNLAAVLPFLFIGGLIGLLFQELIFTISASIVASMVVALTLVPALGARIRVRQQQRRLMETTMQWLQQRYARLVEFLLQHPLVQALILTALLATLLVSISTFFPGFQQFLPQMDDGQIRINISADPGTSVLEMDRSVRLIESLLDKQPEVESVFSMVGGYVFGRSERERSSRSSLRVQLVPREERAFSSRSWIGKMGQLVAQQKLAGIRVRMRTQGIRGVRVSQGSDEVSLRIQGQDLDILASLADEVVKRLSTLPQLLNLEHSLEEIRQELTLSIDRQRAAALDLTAEQIGRSLQLALDGEVVTEYLEGDRAYDIRLRLPRSEVGSPLALEQVILFDDKSRQPLRLWDVASIKLMAAPAEITREDQRRIVEITASLTENTTLGEIHGEILRQLEGLQIPAGYLLYDGGEYKTIQQSQQMGYLLLALALFLVFVVMAVQYESLRNPLVILLTVPFAVIGVALGLRISGLPISMPVWLGMIMLAGIVVNNAIVMVEYIEIARRRGMQIQQAIIEAARLRLRPILMTTLTTVAGMIPLAIGVGEGAEMLQPLALTLIAGLSMSLIVTLLQIPITYNLLVRN